MILYFQQTDQGIKNLPVEKAGELAGSDPDYSNRDLYNAIANGNPVSLQHRIISGSVCLATTVKLLWSGTTMKNTG